MVTLTCVLEFVGQLRGWRATCQLHDGRVITITEAQSPQAARRRMRKAIEEAGLVEPKFEEKLRIPAHLEAVLSNYRTKASELAALEAEVQQMRPRVAQQLLTELNLTEREAAAWLGVSHTHISTLLFAHTADTAPTGEFVRNAPDDGEQTKTRTGSKG